jgi:amino acid transporter
VLFARAAFGEAASFLVGWLAYVSAIFSCSAVMFGLTTAVSGDLGLQGPVAFRLALATLVTVLALVVAAGISLSVRAWTTLTILKLLPLLALVALFLASPAVAAPLAPAADANWARAMLTAVFACQGFEIVPVIAGQVRSPHRSVPLATVGSLLFACLLYVALMWACVATLPSLGQARAPLAEAGAVLGGSAFARAVGIGTSVSALGICFGMMVTTPRYLSALAAGGRRFFDLDHFATNGVPLRALLVTWLLVMTVVQAGNLSQLFALSALAVLVQFGVTASALLTLALRGKRNLGPRHALLAVPVLCLAVFLASRGTTRNEVYASLAALVLGVLLFLSSKPRAEVTTGT